MEENEKKKTVKESAAGKETARKKTAKEKTAEEQAAKKKLAEMNLLDDFLFGAVVTYPQVGEQFVRVLLKTIFGREFKHLSVTAQKVLYGSDTDRHGARLDVYLEPEVEDFEERATVYDIEPDRNDSASDKRELPRRMRFYHAKITARSLNSGAGYDELKNVVIIMIMPYDPFGLGHMVYTVKNKCVEIPEMEYEDGASTLFLYPKGTRGVPNEELRQLLHYMEDSTNVNAVNEDLCKLHKMVKTVKNDPEVVARHMIGYLMRQEELNRMRKEVAEGRAEGRAEGKAEGEFYNKISLICKKLRKNKTLEKIAEELEEEVSAIEPIYSKAKEFAPEYDSDMVFERINADKQ